jgi:predicted nucleic acid-binding protein
MRTALDTNILSALWSNEPSALAITKALGTAKDDGAIVISGTVYCELLAHPNANEAYLKRFCGDTGIAIDLHLRDAAWVEAGRRFANYANRRRMSKSGTPKRLLADFLVGAHALLQAERLMTLDVERYRQDFPELDIYPMAEAPRP